MTTSTRRGLSLTLSLLLALPAASPLAADEPRLGLVTDEVPGWDLERAGARGPASLGAPVLPYDVFATAGGRLRLTLEGGTVVNLGSDTRLRVAPVALDLDAGQFRLRSSPGAAHLVRTPTAQLELLPGDYWVQAEPGLTTVIAYEGGAVVRGLDTNKRPVRVGAGQQTLVAAYAAPERPSSPTAIDYGYSVVDTSVGPDLPAPPPPRVNGAASSRAAWVLALAGLAAGVVAAGVASRNNKSDRRFPQIPRGGD